MGARWSNAMRNVRVGIVSSLSECSEHVCHVTEHSIRERTRLPLGVRHHALDKVLRHSKDAQNVSYIFGVEAETGVVMKPVVQLEQTGCGIASVAALAGVSYRSAQRKASRRGIFAGDSRLWSETHHVRRLPKQYGIRPARAEKPFTSWKDLPDRALLAIKWRREQGRAFWHWVVFWRGPHGPVVLDSKRALHHHVRTDFGRIKPKWFISVRST